MGEGWERVELGEGVRATVGARTRFGLSGWLPSVQLLFDRQWPGSHFCLGDLGQVSGGNEGEAECQGLGPRRPFNELDSGLWPLPARSREMSPASTPVPVPDPCRPFSVGAREA